jgi:hypothetical protein
MNDTDTQNPTVNPVTFTAPAARRIVDATRRVEGMRGDQTGDPRRYYFDEEETCWGVLGAEISPGVWEWTEVVGDHGGASGLDTDYGYGLKQRDGDNSRPEPIKNLARTMWFFGDSDPNKAVDAGGWQSGNVVLLRRWREQIGTTLLPDNYGQWRDVWKIVSPPPNALIFVDMIVTSGDGSVGSPYVYDAAIRSGPVIASGQAGSQWSGAVQVSPANWGIAFYGTIAPSSVPERFFQLIWTNEYPDMSSILPDGDYSCGTGTITITNGWVSGVS